MTSSKGDGTRAYFDRIPSKWRKLYTKDRLIGGAIDRWLRRSLYERWNLVFEHCGPVEGASVLDIGCGTGEYGLEFAARGASRVVGIDFAPGMVEAAESAAQAAGLGGVCRFQCVNFMDLQLDERYDIVLAVGVMDYVDHPEAFLRQAHHMTGRVFLASFPNNQGLWRLQRTVRYVWMKGVRVYDYTADRVRDLCSNAGFPSVDLISLKRGVFAVARPSTTR